MSTLLNERPFKRIATLIACAAGAVSCLAANGTFTVDASRPAGNVSPLFPGLMTEEINHAYDGGLYAELIQNRAFLNDATAPAHWSVVSGSDSAAGITLERVEKGALIDIDSLFSFNDKLTSSLRLTVTKADKNHPAGVPMTAIGEFPCNRTRLIKPRFWHARMSPGRSPSPSSATTAKRSMRPKKYPASRQIGRNFK